MGCGLKGNVSFPKRFLLSLCTIGSVFLLGASVMLDAVGGMWGCFLGIRVLRFFVYPVCFTLGACVLIWVPRF